MRNKRLLTRVLRPSCAALCVTVAAFWTTGLGCSSGSEKEDAAEDDYWAGFMGQLPEDPEPVGKADSAGIPGPAVNTNTSATQVWDARNAWQDTDTSAAREPGVAWGADSGLNWDQKYIKWVDEMPREKSSGSYSYDTFTLTTPFGFSYPAPKLECAELAMFLRITFASWYNLPFYLTSVSDGERIYFGHFGARTKTSPWGNMPNFANSYRDYTGQDVSQGWPEDSRLKSKGLYGGGDEMDFLFEGAKAGAYFDAIFLNKRVGHFMLLTLSYFGSMHLVSSRNTFNLKPSAIQPGDVLLERWQKKGIGHTLVVKKVTALEEGRLEANLASGSMPRRQPKWEDGVASKNYFTSEECGGDGANYDGDEYVKLGGGIKRWRVTKNINGYWTNSWMRDDEASWISDTDYDRLKTRPSEFENILGEVPPEQLREALVAMVEDARNHLRQYPASCSARSRREAAFKDLYDLNESKFSMSKGETDAQYRIMEDYAFAELEYTKSKTCCWNKSTEFMHKIIMDYNESLQASACAEPVVFMNRDSGYQPFADYATETGRGDQWKPWSEDEPCAQRDVANDTEMAHDWVPWCEASSGAN